MPEPETQVDEQEETSSEMEHFEGTFRKLLKVPKSEVDELRKQRSK